MPGFVTPAIPASQTVAINPSVLSAGGTALDLIGLELTQSTRPPIGQILDFADALDVANYFGSASVEAAHAAIYFRGPNNATRTPGQMLWMQYPRVAVAGYLRGGDISSMPLATLAAIDASMTLTIDGGAPATQTVNLTGVTSFSNAAELIGIAFSLEGPSVGSLTASLATTVMTVTVALTFSLSVGMVVTGTGIPDNTYIASFGTCTGAIGTTGTVNLSTSCTTEAAESIAVFQPACYYDAQLGAFVIQSGTTGASSSVAFASGSAATSLLLTKTTGAVLSPGAAAASIIPFMDNVITITQNWLSWMTAWELADAGKQDAATWTNSQNNRYRYCMQDTDAANIAAGGPSAPVAFIENGSSGYLNPNGLSGVVMIHEDSTIDTVGGELAAFAMSWAASLDFTRHNGRQTADLKAQSGLAAQVFSGTIANYLTGYGLNYYGDNTTANEAFVYYAQGSISGPFLWDDSYCNQVWLNNALQLAIMVGLTGVNSVPYNLSGDATIESWCLDPINQAVNFGAIVAGVTLSASQIQQVNNAAGIDIDQVLFQRGWYLQILPAIPQVRRARTSPPCTLWYCDGGSVQQITLASIEVQ